MPQFSYDIVPRDAGWVIELTPAPSEVFPTKQAAFDAAAGLARKLRFVGCSIGVATSHDDEAAPAKSA
jgi:Uncharacterized protein conserved in bacteria (DUF2188)